MQRSSIRIAALLSELLGALCMSAMLALCTASAALAQKLDVTAAALSADIPAQPLGQALQAFARQTGLHLVYVSSLVRNQKSRAAAAGLSADEALTRLLQGTGLKFEFLTAHSVRILAAAPPAADEPAPAPAESQRLLPVVMVTGSLIPVPANVTATGPLQVVTSEDIALGGYSDSVDVVSALPQMITSAGADGGNSSNLWGTTTADLRGLGPQRTLVLINGRRLGPGDPNTGNLFPAPDLDQIPVAMIERVEVLTGGASATYGSDAIAGAVNFILKDHVQGVQVEGQYGFAEHTQQNTYVQGLEAASGTTPPVGTAIDGSKRDVSVLAGTALNHGAGQLTGYFTFHSQDAIYGSERDFADCSAYSANVWDTVPTEPGVVCTGSANSNAFGPAAGQGSTYSVVGNQFIPFPAAGSIPPPFFNFAPYGTVQRPDTRYQAGLLAHLTLNPAATPYLEFNYMDDRTLNPEAPSGLFQFNNLLTPDGNFLVNCSNPLLSAQEAAILCTPEQIAADRAHPGSVSADVDIGRRNIEGGGRLGIFEHRNYRTVGGVRGILSDVWSYDAYAVYYYTSLSNANENFLNLAAVDNALQVTTNPSGRVECISGGSCVPYNIFATGAVTAQQLAYLTITGTDGGDNSEQILHVDVTGQLGTYGFVVPWAHEGVAFNAGADHRADTLRFAADAAELSGELSGEGSAVVGIDQRVSVDEGFLELRVPVVQDQPLAEDLTVDGGYRYSVYSTAGATSTYKAGLQFAPVSDLGLRASFAHAVRAPNLIELYTPLSYEQGTGIPTDPCAPSGATPATASLSQCIHTGLTAAQYGNGIAPAFGGTSTIVQCQGACGAVSGGNPGLAPESADSWSAGFTFTPNAIRTLTGSIDYFHILLRGAIGVVPASVTMNQCLATGDPTWCSQIVRTPAGGLSGNLADGGYVVTRDVNTGAALVSGTDLQMNYRRRLFRTWGAISLGLTGTWSQHNASRPYRSAPSFDCAGLFGAVCLNGSVNPTWRHNLRATWETPWNVQLSAQWRFIGRTDFDNNSSAPLLQYQEEGFFDPVLTHIPSYSYLDLSIILAVSSHVQVRAGVSNVLDKDPPFLPYGDISGATSWAINTFPAYDVVGRSFFTAFRLTF